MSKSPQSTLHPQEARGSHRGHYLVCVGGCCFHVSPAGLSGPGARSLTNGRYREEGTAASDSAGRSGRACVALMWSDERGGRGHFEDFLHEYFLCPTQKGGARLDSMAGHWCLSMARASIGLFWAAFKIKFASIMKTTPRVPLRNEGKGHAQEAQKSSSYGVASTRGDREKLSENRD